MVHELLSFSLNSARVYLIEPRKKLSSHRMLYLLCLCEAAVRVLPSAMCEALPMEIPNTIMRHAFTKTRGER
jgi:hypothetical protein